MVTSYSISINSVHSLYLISLIAQILAFLPTNIIIGKYGIKIGLSLCLLGASIGSGMCLMINSSYTVFIIGYFLCQFWMSSVHTGKGNFVNLYYVEKQVSVTTSYSPLALFPYLETDLLRIMF
jgi:MFS family permease